MTPTGLLRKTHYTAYTIASPRVGMEPLASRLPDPKLTSTRETVREGHTPSLHSLEPYSRFRLSRFGQSAKDSYHSPFQQFYPGSPERTHHSSSSGDPMVSARVYEQSVIYSVPLNRRCRAAMERGRKEVDGVLGPVHLTRITSRRTGWAELASCYMVKCKVEERRKQKIVRKWTWILQPAVA